MKTLQTLVLLLLIFVAGMPVAAQTLPSQPGPNYNPRSANGAFDLVIYVDGEIYLNVQRDRIDYQVLSGKLPRDSGSNYVQPIPRAAFGTFNMEKIAGRGTVELYEEPSASNDYTAILRIYDPRGGADLYHIRLEWTWNPADPSTPPSIRSGTPVRGNVSDARDYDRSRDGEFVFRGRIDGVTAYYIRSDQVRAQVFSAAPPRGELFSFSQPIPSRPFETFEITDVRGRGNVDLVEKPWEGNDYTAVVRIQDDARGSAEYTFRLVWRRQN